MASIGAIDKYFEVGTRFTSFGIINNFPPRTSTEINSKSGSRRFNIWLFRSEQSDITMRRQSFSNRTTHLLATTVCGPVQVVDRNFGTSHFDTSHFINDWREQRRSINQRSRNIAGTKDAYDFKTRRRIAASGRDGMRKVKGRNIK